MLLALSGLSVAAVAQNTTEVTEEVLEVVEELVCLVWLWCYCTVW